MRGKSNITCPQCRSSHAVPMGGVRGFPADLVLQNALDIESLQGSKASAKPIPCNMCTEDDPATAHCPTCSKFLCDFCCKAHKRLVDYRSHKVVPLDKMDTEAMKAFERPLHCPQHTEEVLKLYCKTCNVLICRDCTIVNHREHKFGFVKDIRPEIQQQLQEMKQAISLKQQEFQKHLEYTKSAERSRESHSSALEIRINTSFDAAIVKLESQRKQLLQQEANARSTDMKQIWAQKESVEVTLANIAGSLGYIEQLCSCPNDRDMLAMSSEAIKQLSSLQEKCWSSQSRLSLLTFTDMELSSEAVGTLKGVSFTISIVCDGVNPQVPIQGQSMTYTGYSPVSHAIAMTPAYGNQLSFGQSIPRRDQEYGTSRSSPSALRLGQSMQLTVQVTSNDGQELTSLAVPSISITDNARGNKLTAYTMQHQGRGSWLLTIEPLYCGRYTVQASLRHMMEMTQSPEVVQSQQYVTHARRRRRADVVSSSFPTGQQRMNDDLCQHTFTVTGAPAIGTRVRRGPNWQDGDEDGGQGGKGTVTQQPDGEQVQTSQQYEHQQVDYRQMPGVRMATLATRSFNEIGQMPGQYRQTPGVRSHQVQERMHQVSVKWDNGNSGIYTWNEHKCIFHIELVPGLSH